MRIDVNELRVAAAGQWLQILGQLLPEISEAINGFTPRRRPGAFCPVHGGKSGEAFSLLRDAPETGGGVCNTCGCKRDGFELLMWAKGWSFRQTLEEVAKVVGSQEPAVDGHRQQQQRQQATDEELAEDEKTRKKMQSWWDEAVPLNTKAAEPARLYFKSRGIPNVGLLGGEVRLHPALAYWQKPPKGAPKSEKPKFLGKFPCLVSLIRDPSGKPVSVHRTYLTTGGRKAPVPEVKKNAPKMVTRPITGGAIQLCIPVETMGVAEGLETTLAVAHVTGMAMWCCANVGLLMSWQPPAGVKRVVIWADLDAGNGGMDGARALAERLSDDGIEVTIAVPPLALKEGESSVDWADVLVREGAAGFPSLQQLFDY